MSVSSTRWPAPAKLNLFLHITGRRADGYHLLQTAFQFIDYCDWLEFSSRTDGRLIRVVDLPGVDVADDLVMRAAALLQQYSACQLGAEIKLDKRLPMGGGIGGGSSDAATTLVVLNRLWQLNVSVDELAKLGLSLGADVPVFVRGHAAWAEGIGEELTPITLPEPWFVVLVPKCHVSTPELFLNKNLTRDVPLIKMPAFVDGQTQNVFEPIVREAYPEVDEALLWLEKYSRSKLTGTGACVFASFDSETQAQSVLKELPEGWEGFAAKGLNRSPLIDKLGKMGK